MNDYKLRPCPFCGGAAELDRYRAYRAINGQSGTETAIYCTECIADMSFCHEDLPEYTMEQIVAMVIEHWNRRAPHRALDGDTGG